MDSSSYARFSVSSNLDLSLFYCIIWLILFYNRVNCGPGNFGEVHPGLASGSGGILLNWLPSISQYLPIFLSIVQYCPVLPSIAQYCPLLPSIIQYCTVLPSVGQCWPSAVVATYWIDCPVFFSDSQYFQVLPSIAQYCPVLPSIASIVQYCAV